ncbi:hypothetical protein [Streptomyces sp. Je 1-369]|nr:hypothetical protein [Streptomyces sp. Je 1-369]WAL93734.1 hypothetical protein NOO62_04040 [Streptomyces sp. Je 1-369]
MAHPWAARGLHDVGLDRSPAASHTLYGTEVAAERLRVRMLSQSRIVAVGDPPGQPRDRDPRERTKRQVLADHFEKCRVLRPQGAHITLYARPGHC